MTNTITHIPTAVLSSHLVSLEAQVRAEFLGPDLTAACNCAEFSGAAVLKCSAALDLPARERAFKAWRRVILIQLLREVPEVEQFLYAGELEDEFDCEGGLQKLDNEISRMRLRAAEEATANHADNRAQMNAALVHNFIGRDTDDYVHPRLVVIRAGSREMKLFSSDARARAWGKEDACGFELYPLDLSGIVRKFVS